MNELDQKLREYYSNQTLPPDRVDMILASAKIVRPSVWRRVSIPAFAVAAIAVLAMITWSVVPSPGSRVFAEVAKNHAKHLAPEVLTDDFAAIQAALPRLKFPIAPTRPQLLGGLTVVGGRYCSIQGEPAAQISLESASGEICTLYIAPLTGSLARLKPGVATVGDVRVEIWQDANRLFVLARPQA